MFDYQITNPGNIVNGQLLRRKMAHLTQQLGVVAQTQATGTTDTVEPVLATLKAIEAHLMNVKGYTFKASVLTPTAPVKPTDPLWVVPSILYNQAGACVRELLIRATQQAVYDAEVSSPDTAKALLAMINDVAADLRPLAPTPPPPPPPPPQAPAAKARAKVKEVPEGGAE